MRTFKTIAELISLVGEEIAVSEWTLVTQKRVTQFAEATGDHQWIHVDPERAKAGPFGGTIAHGFLTLSLLPHFLETSIVIDEVRMGLNYGLNKVRFTDPVPAESKLRGRFKLLSVEAVPDNGFQLTWQVTMERENSSKPACVAEALVRLYR